MSFSSTLNSLVTVETVLDGYGTGGETGSRIHDVASSITYSDVEAGNGQASYEKRNAGD